MTKTTDGSVVGVSETKLDNSISSSEIEIEGYDLWRLDWSRRVGGVACYVKKSLAYNYKHNFCKNKQHSFNDIFLPKIKPILVSILYRPHLEATFTGCNILEKQECYLLGDFNANLLQNGENIFEKKWNKSKLKSLPSLAK